MGTGTNAEAATRDNLILPQEADIIRVLPLTETEKQFTLRPLGGEMRFTPGQILEVSAHGFGEIPVGFASSPTRRHTFDIVVSTADRESAAINRLETGDSLFVRGPLGNGFDLEALNGQPVLIVAGGIGLCPARGLIQYILDRRSEFGDVKLFYGAASPNAQLFLDDLARWRHSNEVDCYETVERPDADWRGHVGVVTTLFRKVTIPADTRVIVSGPSVMCRFVIAELHGRQIPHDHIYLVLERRPTRGASEGGQINDKHVCLDGPVFTYEQVEHLEEAFG